MSPTLRENLVNDHYYHIFNRGADKREIFLDDEDRFRFLHDLWEFNDKNCVAQTFLQRQTSRQTIGEPFPNSFKREKLVDILCFCLMPNHFHFILKQLVDGGISLFMRKLGGYVTYFNQKYERSGVLFQGRFKAKLIETDEQMVHLSRYIHIFNPGELFEPKIRDGVLKNTKDDLNNFLKNYKWSSYLDYIGIKNYPSLINKEFLMSYFSARGGSALGGKDEKEYEKFSVGLITPTDNFADFELD